MLGYTYNDRTAFAHCWYIEANGTVVDMTLPERFREWSYIGYVVTTDEWKRRVQARGDNRLDVLTDAEINALGIVRVECY